MKQKAFFIFFLLLALGFEASAQGEVTKSRHVLCRNKRIIRRIQVQETKEGCRTIYTKAGVDREIGSGRYKATCQNFLHNVKVNLEKAGWSCRDISNVGVTTK